METDNTVFKIPEIERKIAYNFDVVDETSPIYQELNQISEEIEQCRLRNL